MCVLVHKHSGIKYDYCYKYDNGTNKLYTYHFLSETICIIYILFLHENTEFTALSDYTKENLLIYNFFFGSCSKNDEHKWKFIHFQEKFGWRRLFFSSDAHEKNEDFINKNIDFPNRQHTFCKSNTLCPIDFTNFNKKLNKK